MEINPDSLQQSEIYKLMTGAIVPRPIGWISTVDENGLPNLAPFSYFNAVSSKPPHLMFCPGIRGTDDSIKDTLTNVRQTEEFVVNIVTEALAEAMNITATELPPDVDEFEYAGLESTPSEVVKVPRVKASPIHFECKMTQIVEVAPEPGGGVIVIGRIVHIHVNEAVLMDDYKINIEALQPIGRLAGSYYSRVNDLFKMYRRPSER